MTTRKYSSRSQQTTLSAAINATTTTANVVSGTSLLGGATVSAGETFTVVIDPDTALEEIVDVSAVSTNTLTISRGVDGASPGTGSAHSAGAVVRHMAIGRDYREANQHIENTTTAHGVTLANLVKTTDSGVVTSGMILDGTIVNADINASAAIADTKLATISTASKVSNSATTATSANTASAIVARDASGNFTAGTVTANLTGNVTGNVSGSAGSVTNGVYTTDTGTVTSTMIANGTIVDADVNASAAIAKTKLNLGGTITSADLVDGTIVATDIADGTITAAKMVTDPYARANHTGTQLAATVSDFNTAVRTNRLDQMAAPTASVALNAQKITGLGTPTANTTDAATTAYVDTAVANLVNSAPGTLDTLGEIATAIQAGGSVFDAMVLKAGSTMTGALTLSGAPTVGLHAATKTYVDTVAGSTAAAQAAQAAAEAALDSFDDRYLGAKSSAPSVDNDGNALATGALYWNTPGATMYAWTGSAWGSISSTAAIFRYRFTAAGGETSESGLDDNGVTLSYIPGKEQVYLNGVLLVRSTDYVASNGTSISSLAALTAGDILEIITFTSFDLATAIDKALFDAKGDILVATAADTPGKLTVGTNGYVLKANSATATGLEWGVYDPLPSQTGNNGEFLKTNGSTTSWEVVSQVPSQTGNSGKYLTTDGTTSSWGTVSTPVNGSIRIPKGSTLSKTATFSFTTGIYNVNLQGPVTSITVGSKTVSSIQPTTTVLSSHMISLPSAASVSISLNDTYSYPFSGAGAGKGFPALAYGNNLFIAGGYGGTLITSTDAITWDTRNSQTSADLQCAAYDSGDNIYALGGGAGYLRTSTDGITWTSRTVPFAGNDVRALTYGNGILVAGGNAGYLATSTDGVTWTARTSNFGTSGIRALTFGNNLYVAGGLSAKISTSTDGITWTTRNSGMGGTIQALAYGAGVYVAADSSGKLSSSTDAITWTSRDPNNNGNSFANVTFGNGAFVGIAGNRISTSTDGITWTTRLAANGSGQNTIYGSHVDTWVIGSYGDEGSSQINTLGGTFGNTASDVFISFNANQTVTAV